MQRTGAEVASVAENGAVFARSQMFPDAVVSNSLLPL